MLDILLVGIFAKDVFSADVGCECNPLHPWPSTAPEDQDQVGEGGKARQVGDS